jgi:hypothetical protein
VWHASIAPQIGTYSSAVLRQFALKALDGVGSEALGQWEESTATAFHIRRRLTPEEEARVGPAVDIRGTEESMKRFDVVRRLLPRHVAESIKEPF